MGYLLYMDALGIQGFYKQGVNIANPIMDRICETAKSIFGASIPNSSQNLSQIQSNKLVIMNDSVFMYSEHLEYVLFFATKFAKIMFILMKNVEPIAFRGGISKTENIPKIICSEENNISTTKFVIDNISAAMIADKKRISGPRIIIHKDLIDKNIFSSWDIKYQTMLMDIHKPENTKSDFFNNDLNDYYDLTWLIPFDEKQAQKIEKNIHQYWVNAVSMERASIHASALLALYKTSLVKKESISNVIKILYSGLQKEGKFTGKLPKNITYDKLLVTGQMIKSIRDLVIYP